MPAAAGESGGERFNSSEYDCGVVIRGVHYVSYRLQSFCDCCFNDVQADIIESLLSQNRTLRVQAFTA